MNAIKTEPERKQTARCPSCCKEGSAVKAATLRSLIGKERQGRITVNHYFFCGSHGCDIVYFTEDGSRAFYKEDLTVRVGVKESKAPRPICYCFNHTVEGIFDEIKQTGKSTVIDDITSRMKKDGCFCETKNPQGSCCLKTVKQIVKEALRQSGTEVNETVTGTGHNDRCRQE